MDNNSTILARYPEPEKCRGKSLPDSPLIKTILARQEEGTAEAAGVDSVQRLHVFAPFHASVTRRVYASPDIPLAMAFAVVDRALWPRWRQATCWCCGR